MPETMIKEIADRADMIIRGYAFTRDGDRIRVFNLNDRESSMIITPDGIIMAAICIILPSASLSVCTSTPAIQACQRVGLQSSL